MLLYRPKRRLTQVSLFVLASLGVIALPFISANADDLYIIGGGGGAGTDSASDGGGGSLNIAVKF